MKEKGEIILRINKELLMKKGEIILIMNKKLRGEKGRILIINQELGGVRGRVDNFNNKFRLSGEKRGVII